MGTKITAIILNYKNLTDTLSCLRSIKETDLGDKVSYLVVDNSPTIKNKKTLADNFPKTEYLASPKNLGFAGGNNLGIKKALLDGADFVLIVNPDVLLPQVFFKTLLENFKNKNVGIVAPAIAHQQKGCSMYGLEGSVDWAKAKPKHRNVEKLNSKKPIISEFVTFACVIISKDTFNKVGLMDDGYFMYFEDVDYCLSAGKKGTRIILDPSIVVTHRTSSSFAKPTDKLLINFKSHLRFIGKWLPLPGRIMPFLHVFVLYPYLYLLWTYHYYKYCH